MARGEKPGTIASIELMTIPQSARATGIAMTARKRIANMSGGRMGGLRRPQ